MPAQSQWSYRGGIVMFDGATAQASYKGESSPLFIRSARLPEPSRAAAGWVDAKIAEEAALRVAPAHRLGKPLPTPRSMIWAHGIYKAASAPLDVPLTTPQAVVLKGGSPVTPTLL